MPHCWGYSGTSLPVQRDAHQVEFVPDCKNSPVEIVPTTRDCPSFGPRVRSTPKVSSNSTHRCEMGPSDDRFIQRNLSKRKRPARHPLYVYLTTHTRAPSASNAEYVQMTTIALLPRAIPADATISIIGKTVSR